MKEVKYRIGYGSLGMWWRVVCVGVGECVWVGWVVCGGVGGGLGGGDYGGLGVVDLVLGGGVQGIVSALLNPLNSNQSYTVMETHSAPSTLSSGIVYSPSFTTINHTPTPQY